MPIALTVNGVERHVNVYPHQTLLSLLRDDLDLIGTKYGCGEGQCGACTVLVDGEPRRSCLTEVASIAGRNITTIEGIEQNGQLHPLQQAFLDVEAMQCGYCTPGMIVEGVALLRRKSTLVEADIVQAMDGHICRCGTYPRIIDAIRRAAAARGKQA